MRSQLLGFLLLPLAALSSATDPSRPNLGTLMARCDPATPRGTLWIADDRAYTCAPFPDAQRVASPGDYCISANSAELSGPRDTCGSHSDCGPGGYCVDVQGLRRVCWRLTWDQKCADAGK